MKKSVSKQLLSKNLILLFLTFNLTEYSQEIYHYHYIHIVWRKKKNPNYE